MRGRDHGEQEPQIKRQGGQGGHPPHEGAGAQAFAKPRAFPSHLLIQEGAVILRHDGGAAGPGLVNDFPSAAQHKVGQGAVIAEGGGHAHPALVQPGQGVLVKHLAPVGGKRTGEAGHAIKNALRSLHDPEAGVVADGLHFGQQIGPGVFHVAVAGGRAHVRIGKGIHHVADGVGLEKTVRVGEDEDVAGGQLRARRQRAPLAHGALQVDQDQLGIFFLHLQHDGKTLVATAVVYGDHLQAVTWIGNLQGLDQGAFDELLLVVDREDDADQGQGAVADRGRTVKGREQKAGEQIAAHQQAVQEDRRVEPEIVNVLQLDQHHQDHGHQEGQGGKPAHDGPGRAGQGGADRRFELNAGLPAGLVASSHFALEGVGAAPNSSGKVPSGTMKFIRTRVSVAGTSTFSSSRPPSEMSRAMA